MAHTQEEIKKAINVLVMEGFCIRNVEAEPDTLYIVRIPMDKEHGFTYNTRRKRYSNFSKYKSKPGTMVVKLKISELKWEPEV